MGVVLGDARAGLELMFLVAERFGRAEPRRTAREFVAGLLRALRGTPDGRADRAAFWRFLLGCALLWVAAVPAVGQDHDDRSAPEPAAM